MTQVIKQDNQKEEFDMSKLRESIQRACDDCDISEEEAKEIVAEVSASVGTQAQQQEQIRAADLRRQVLRELDAEAPQVAEAWREYDREQKGR